MRIIPCKQGVIMYLELINTIQKIHKNLTCPVCGRHFKMKEIKIRYIFDEILILSLNCKQNHRDTQTIHITTLEKTKRKTNKAQANNINKQIEEFDGDFISLWKK